MHENRNKRGIEFKHWGLTGNRLFHGFCDCGPAIEGRSPHLYWLCLANCFLHGSFQSCRLRNAVSLY